MDSFTQQMMNRATSRRAEFEHHMKEILSINDGIDDPNLEILLENKKREYREILRHGNQESGSSAMNVDDKENTSGESTCAISEATKSRLKKLVPLYTEEDPSGVFPSPVGYGRRQAKRELAALEANIPPPGKYSQQRSKRLAQLASNINNWEDESDKKLLVPPRSEQSPPKPTLKPVSSPALRKKMANFQDTNLDSNKETRKKVVIDDKVLQNLEMQGFQRCESEQHLVFDYRSPRNSPARCSKVVAESRSPRRSVSPEKRVPPPPPMSPVKSPSKMSPVHHDAGSNRWVKVDLSPSKPNHERSPSPVKVNTPQNYSRSRSASPSKPNHHINFGSPNKVTFASPPKAPCEPRHRTPTKPRAPPPPTSPPKNAPALAKSLMQETLPVKKMEQTPRQKSPVKPTGSAVLEMAAKYETDSTPPKKTRDPTEMTINERKAIFERNHGGAILPKAPFGMPVPAKVLQRPAKSPERGVNKVELVKSDRDSNVKDHVAQSILERQKEIEMLRSRWDRKREENVLQGGPTAIFPPTKKVSSPPNKIKMGTRSPVRGDSSPETPPHRYVSPKSKHQTRSPRKSSELVEKLSQVKKIKVSPPKHGRIYPSISDIETESETVETEAEPLESDYDFRVPNAFDQYGSDSEESAISFGQAVVMQARNSQANLKRGITTSTIRSSSSSSSDTLDTSAQESRILHEMDDFLDEALSDVSVSPPKRPRETPPHCDLPPSKPSGSCLAESFEYQSDSRKPNLVHTVSTYRKTEAQKTPRQQMYSIEMEVEQALEKETPESALVQEKVFELEQEMIKQTTIISQATQALNLCIARPEFSGSAEQVEAEKLLLIATSRRTATLREIERLKVEKTLKPGSLKRNADKGSLTIEYISLPIKMCPTEPDKTEYFMCLVTSAETVQATQVLALKKQNLTRGNRLAFTKMINLENLYCDFTVTIEVYKLSCKNANAGSSNGPETKEDKKLASKLRLTPQKKNTSRRNNKIPIESPGGPNSVRTPSFKMVGYVVFSLREIKRNKFTLNKVPYGVPLDGTIELSMSSALKSEVEYRGFLTQFEEVTGFGAWKRKWALLKGSTITFWLYPEHEEQNKIPIDTVDLSGVRNKEVGLVSREVCARPHTILLETDCGEQKLLSADTTEDRLAWCKAINKSLQLIRAWGGKTF